MLTVSEKFNQRELVKQTISDKNCPMKLEDEMMDVTEDIGEINLDSSKKARKKKKKAKKKIEAK